MPDKPAAEVRIDEALVRHLVVTQAEHVLPGAAAQRPVKTAEGWDSEVWRLGEDLAVRLPRRAAAAPLVLHEQRSLALIAPAIEAFGVGVPRPLVRGIPDDRFPWPWSIVPWIEGSRGIDVPRSERTGWVERLAPALLALHIDAPADHPVNPVRGVPLATRSAAFGERAETLAGRGERERRWASALGDAWAEGLEVEPWTRSPVWIHGDLHPANLVAHGAELRGIVDFGDVTAGDPAYDLAIAWLAFDRRGRERFVDATENRYDDATWIRARAWAAAVTVLLLVHSDDEPDYAGLAAESASELADGS